MGSNLMARGAGIFRRYAARERHLQLNIPVLADEATFGDPQAVTDAMVDAFALIRQAAGMPPRSHRPQCSRIAPAARRSG